MKHIDLTDFEKKAWEFYTAVQELSLNDPQWSKSLAEMAELLKQKRKEFESLSLVSDNERKNTDVRTS